MAIESHPHDRGRTCLVLLALATLACASKSDGAATATTAQPAAPEPASARAEPTASSAQAAPEDERVTPAQVCAHMYAIISQEAKDVSADKLAKGESACIRDMTEGQNVRGDEYFQRFVVCIMQAQSSDDLTICVTPKTEAICKHVTTVMGRALGYVVDPQSEDHQILLDECAYDLEETRKSMKPPEYYRYAECMMKTVGYKDIDACNGDAGLID
jgi:hypothetical protein